MRIAIVFAMLLFTLVTLVAQPTMLWKRDQMGYGNIIRWDPDRHILYHISSAGLTHWDTKADTLLRRSQLKGHYRSPVVLNDSMVFGKDSDRYHYRLNYLTGEEVWDAAWDNDLDIVDPWGRLAARWTRGSGPLFLIVVDPQTMEERARLSAERPLTLLGASVTGDTLYINHSYAVSAMRLEGAIDSIWADREIAVKEEVFYIAGLFAAEDGSVLLYFRTSGTPYRSYLKRIDPETRVLLDSVWVGEYQDVFRPFVAGNLQPGARSIFNPRPDGSIYIRVTQDTMVFISSPPMMVKSVHSIQARSASQMTQYVRGPLVTIGDNRSIVTFDERDASWSQVLPDRFEIKNVAQLHDLRLAITRDDQGLIDLDTKDGENLGSVFPPDSSGRPIQPASYVVTSPTSPNIVHAFNNTLRLVNGITGATICQIDPFLRDDQSSQESIWDVRPEWLSADGSTIMGTYVWSNESKFSGSDFYGIGAFSSTSPCVNDSLHASAPIHITSLLQKYTRSGEHHVSVSDDGDYTLAPVGWHDTTVLLVKHRRDRRLRWDTVANFTDRHTGLFLHGSTRAVLDDDRGLAVIDANVGTIQNVIDLGQHHVPLAAYHNRDAVLTFSNAGISLVNISTASIEWSIAKETRPTSIVVDHRDRFFVVNYIGDRMELWAEDTTVHVDERSTIPSTLRLFPNPAQDVVDISGFPIADNITITVVDNIGRCVARIDHAGDPPATLDVRSLSVGAYTIVTTSNTGISVGRLMRCK
jgi:hypothetical protein